MLFLIMVVPFYALPLLYFSVFIGPLVAVRIAGRVPLLDCIDILLPLVIGILLLRRFLQEKDFFQFHISHIGRAFILFLLCILLSSFGAINRLRALMDWKGYLWGFLLYLLGYTLTTNKKKSKNFFYFLASWGSILTLLVIHSILQTENLMRAIVTRAVNLSWGQTNYIAAFYVVLIPIVISLIFNEKLMWRKSLFLLITLFLFSGLIFTSSRGGMIATMVAIFILLAGLLRRNLSLQLVSVIGFIILVVWLHPASKFLILRFVDFQTSISALTRIVRWEETWHVFKSHPIFGVGLENLCYHLQHFSYLILSAHNLILEALSQTGIIGLFGLMFLFFSTFKMLLKNYRITRNPLAWGVFSGALGAVIHSMVEPNFGGTRFAIFFWGIIGVTEKMLMYRKKDIK
ncbi:O-antigen ligase family protein [candidate division WOR-3 bacterium]|nr:O-antigen ligase family protein [candidate division WOR-3 bacterium]